MKIFVYGTLKHGFGNNRLLNGADFIGAASTVRPFVLLDSGFPVLTPVGTGNMRVRGEVYEFIDARILKQLDRLEGEGRMYDRKLIDVVDDDGNEIEVWAYIGCEDAFNHNPLGLHWLGRDGTFDFAYPKPNRAERKRTADRVDGFDRDDLGESPDY
jgi:gamma-glutamylcyclotransferase (GGCT)/AIG2-like uncharacterized protein YtfP